MPNAPILVGVKGESLFELPTGTNHQLLLFNGSTSKALCDGLATVAVEAFEGYGDWIEVFVVVEDTRLPVPLPPEVTLVGDPEHSMHDRYGADHPCLYLIRPDGYVAYRSLQIDSLAAYFDHSLQSLRAAYPAGQ